MKPTDDELEAMAVKFDVMRASYEAVGVSGEYGAEAMKDAAATLRALSADLEAEKGWRTVAESNQQMAKSWQDRAIAAEAEVARLRDALFECQEEIDAYIQHEYPHDHPVQERYRQRDYAANPARIALQEKPHD
jgi:hypothetical protein